MVATIAFWEKSFKVEGETGPRVCMAERRESSVEVGCECRRGVSAGGGLVDDGQEMGEGRIHVGVVGVRFIVLWVRVRSCWRGSI